jgi:predicted MFS family arabinose efflux permease
VAILQGVLATAGYWLMWNQMSAMVVSLCVGFTYITANLVQYDLAARICPPQVSATVFASLMSVTNIGISLSFLCGGYLYDRLGSYDAVWWLGVALGIFAAIVHWPIRERPVRRMQLAAAE